MQNAMRNYIPQMTYRFSPHQRKYDVVILLTLESVYSGDFTWLSNQRVVATSLLHHISNKMFLTIVCGEDGNLFSRIPKQT